MMWPKIARDSDGYMLAASHAIGRNAVIDEEVAAQLGAVLLRRYPERLAERYKLQADAVAALDGEGLVEAVARRRGFLIKGGGIDLEKAALTLRRITGMVRSAASAWRRRRAGRRCSKRRDWQRSPRLNSRPATRPARC
jgi:ribosome biogenesis GTPase A